MADEGSPNHEIADKVNLSPQGVCKWWQRYLGQGLSGLHDELRPGQPPSTLNEKVTILIPKTFQTKPPSRIHWTIKSIVKETKLSQPMVHRIRQSLGLQPHCQRHFEVSTAPSLVVVVRNIVGPYLNLPGKVMVLWVDEKSQIQLVVDNYATHKHPTVKRRLASHPRYQVHHTPTYVSWLNQIQIWFNLITQRAIRQEHLKTLKD